MSLCRNKTFIWVDKTVSVNLIFTTSRTEIWTHDVSNIVTNAPHQLSIAARTTNQQQLLQCLPHHHSPTNNSYTSAIYHTTTTTTTAKALL